MSNIDLDKMIVKCVNYNRFDFMTVDFILLTGYADLILSKNMDESD